jgi:acetyl-CoA/propionyl-CoA carboxylase biotin carboxyl carrier protein
MLAKVIAWGETREQALGRLDRALADTVVLGVPTNIEYLRLLLADVDVRAGRLDTGLIERKLPGLAFAAPSPLILAAAALVQHAAAWEQDGSVWSRPSGWRMGPHRPTVYRIAAAGGEPVEVRVQGAPDAASVSVGSQPPAPASLRRTPGSDTEFRIEFDGTTQALHIVREPGGPSGGARLWLGHSGASFLVAFRTRQQDLAAHLAGRENPAGTASPDVRSPMPGTVVTVSARTGDTVQAGDVLLTVEAMKMEHRLTAALAGVVSMSVAPGDLVKLDQVVASIQPDPAPNHPTVNGDNS